MGVVESYHKHERGVVLIFLNQVKENSKCIDIVRQYDGFYVHKQIEVKDGLLFVRLKKRLSNVHA